MRQMFRWKSIWLRWCNLTINNIGKDLHKSDKCVLWTLRQGDRFSWISNLVSLSILVSHSSLSKLLESQSTLIQAVTVIIYTWKIWETMTKKKTTWGKLHQLQTSDIWCGMKARLQYLITNYRRGDAFRWKDRGLRVIKFCCSIRPS